MPTQIVYRDSKTGRFTTAQVAKRRPSTTEHQRIRHKPRKRKKPK